jgi:hypothetical protein
MSYLASVGAAVKAAFNPTPTPASAENTNGNMNFQQAPVQNQAPAGNTQTPVVEQKPVDPLAGFSKMYENTSTPDAPPAFKLDSAQLKTVADNQDFTKGIDPALLQRATSGDTSALIEVIQASSRNAYQTALAHNSSLTEGFVTAREGFAEKGLTGKVKNELTVNALTGTQNFDNPVVRKQLVSVAMDLQRQHPDASPQEIAAEARRYITELANAINPQTTATPSSRNKETDWDSYFN